MILIKIYCLNELLDLHNLIVIYDFQDLNERRGDMSHNKREECDVNFRTNDVIICKSK